MTLDSQTPRHPPMTVTAAPAPCEGVNLRRGVAIGLTLSVLLFWLPIIGLLVLL